MLPMLFLYFRQMRTFGSRTGYYVTGIAILGTLVLLRVSPVVAATQNTPSVGEISGCGSDNNYGCSYWWDTSLEGNAIPGQTVYFSFNFYNTNPCNCSIVLGSFTLQTPWANYSDPSLPQVIYTGYNYYNGIAITIPLGQDPGTVGGVLQFTGHFADGSPFCSSTGDTCSYSADVTIMADPATLQTQVNSLQAQVANYSSQVTSLTAQVTNLQSKIASLDAQLGQADSNVTSDMQTIATDQGTLTQTQTTLATAKSNLASAQSQLAAEESELASTQSSLSSTTGVYLPLAAAIPAVVAALFAVLYLRKKPTVSVPR